MAQESAKHVRGAGPSGSSARGQLEPGRSVAAVRGQGGAGQPAGLTRHGPRAGSGAGPGRCCGRPAFGSARRPPSQGSGSARPGRVQAASWSAAGPPRQGRRQVPGGRASRAWSARRAATAKGGGSAGGRWPAGQPRTPPCQAQRQSPGGPGQPGSQPAVSRPPPRAAAECQRGRVPGGRLVAAGPSRRPRAAGSAGGDGCPGGRLGDPP